MRGAIITTLKALYEGKEVTAGKSLECSTTRITNEISSLRNDFGIDIITDRINTDSGKWYGSYRLVRSRENLQKVRELLKKYSKENDSSNNKYGLI